MLRKFLLISGLSFFAANAVFADNISYVGVGIGYQAGQHYGGFLPQLFGGFGQTFGCTHLYYMGGEVFAGFPSIPASGNNDNRIMWDFGLSIMPGIFLNANYLLYGKLGLQTVNINQNNANKTGVNIGLGIQTSLSARWDIRAEYLYFSDGIFNNITVTRANNLNLLLVYRIT